MKRVLTILLVLLATTLLVGCISIPLGDGEKLTIGFSGINIEADGEQAEEESESNDLKENEEPNQEEAEDSNNNQNNDVDQVADEPDDSTENNRGEEDIIECQEDIGTLIERVPPNFPIPDCITEVSTNSAEHSSYMYYTGSYATSGDWKDIFNLYKDYLQTNYKVSSDSQSASEGALKYSSEEFELYVSIRQSTADDELVRISFTNTVYFDLDE